MNRHQGEPPVLTKAEMEDRERVVDVQILIMVFAAVAGCVIAILCDSDAWAIGLLGYAVLGVLGMLIMKMRRLRCGRRRPPDANCWKFPRPGSNSRAEQKRKYCRCNVIVPVITARSGAGMLEARIIADGRDYAHLEISSRNETAIDVFARRCGGKRVELWFAGKGQLEAPVDVVAHWRELGAAALAVQTLRRRATTFRLLGFERVSWI
ncbi:hypothetical protein [Azospirillum sp. sgz302134]